METVAVVGLGYVGLPLAVALGKIRPTVGYDPNEEKVASYRRFEDPTGEVAEEDLKAAAQLECSSDPSIISRAALIIVAVPTPIDAAHQPDFTPLVAASETVGKYLSEGAIVIYESTVYPGATEEVCVPILEQQSGLRWKRDFHVGYSPERINPGDHEHRLETIVKVVSGDDEPTLEKVAVLYESVVTAGVHRASSIKVAEAAKVIENTQRDLNIALMNELALIFNRLDLDTAEVLQAAGTKWNFLPFRPGLVGGHCIGVDPYYLTHKAEMVGYNPQVILAGRRINDGMGKFIAEQTIKQVIANGHCVKDSRIAVLGVTFKEDCPDTRNSRVVDVVQELKSYGVNVFVHDPAADPDEVQEEYGFALSQWEDLRELNAIVLAVAHREYKTKTAQEFAQMMSGSGSFTDVKSAMDEKTLEAEGFSVWRLRSTATTEGKYKPMKIFVTGAAGFIGNNLSLRLTERGDEVVGIDNMNDYYDTSLKEARLSRLSDQSKFQFVKLDLEDRPGMAELFEKHRFDAVMNLAAQAGVRYSIENPYAYIDSNLVGFGNILEGCRQTDVKHLVYASTSSVYGSNTRQSFSEHDGCNHQVSLYAATKKANEVMAHSYAHLYGLASTGLRFFTVYGPWGRPDMALFKFTKGILADEPIPVFNRGEMVRDFTYIDDIVEGVIRTIDNPPLGNSEWSGDQPDPATSYAPWRVFNIGNNQSVPLMRYIEVLEECLGKKAKLDLLPMQPGDVPSTLADSSELMECVGFKPDTTIEVGIRAFVDWYREYYG